MSLINGKSENRMFVKITFSESGKQSLADVYYFKNEMTVDFFIRWKWYFEYRYALLRVKYPKAFILLSHGPYEYVLPDENYKEKIKNRFLSDKRQLTKFNNKLESIRQNWNELFPIEEHPEWLKVKSKLDWYEKQYSQSKLEYDNIFK